MGSRSSGRTTCRTTSALSRSPGGRSRRPAIGADPGRSSWSAGSGPGRTSAALGAPLRTAEDQAQEEDPKVTLSSMQGVEAGGLESPPAVGNLDLGKRHRVQVGTRRGQDVAEPPGVFVDGLVGTWPKAEPPGEPDDPAVDPVGFLGCARAALPGNDHEGSHDRDQQQANQDVASCPAARGTDRAGLVVAEIRWPDRPLEVVIG